MAADFIVHVNLTNKSASNPIRMCPTMDTIAKNITVCNFYSFQFKFFVVVLFRCFLFFLFLITQTFVIVSLGREVNGSFGIS